MNFENEYEAFKFVWDKESDKLRTEYLKSERKPKCDEAASLIKDVANKSYLDKDYEKCEDLYYKALMVAKYNGPVYGTVLSNMSAIYFAKGNYEKCIDYIKLSEKSEYPKTSFPKLYVREIKAWKKLGDKNKTTEAFNKLQDFIENIELDAKEKDKLDKYMNEARNVLIYVDADETNCYDDSQKLIPEMVKNPKYINISNKADLKYDKEYGNHIVATAKLKKGDPILVEDPYIAVSITNFCANCLNLLEFPFPCDSCSNVIYCSERCRRVHKNQIHRWECKLFQCEASDGFNGRVILGYRVFLKGLISGYKSTSDIEQDLSSKKESVRFFNVCNMYKSFKTFSNDLMKLMGFLKSCVFIVNHIVYETKLLKWIMDNKIFGSIGNTTQLIYTIGQKILELSLICHFNHFTYGEDRKLTVFLYQTYSKLNHSCLPNTIKYMSGSTLVIKASEDIEEGEQIFTSYGQFHFPTHPKEDRPKLLLLQYGFKCKCKVCCDPLLYSIDNELSLKCQYCDAYALCKNASKKCYSCKRSEKLTLELSMKLKDVLDLITFYKNDLRKDTLVSAINICDEVQINPKHSLVLFCNLNLAKHEIIEGNLEKGLKFATRVEMGNSLLIPYELHAGVFEAIEHFTKEIYYSRNPYKFLLKRESIDELLDFLNQFTDLINLCNPKKHIFDSICVLKKYYTVQKDVLQVNELAKSLKWRK